MGEVKLEWKGEEKRKGKGTGAGGLARKEVGTRKCSGPWEGRVRRPCGKGRHFGGRGTGAPSWGQWVSVEFGQGRRAVVTKWENTKKTTPSWLQDAIMHRVSVNVHNQQEHSVNNPVTLCLLYYCFRKINHLVLVPFAFILWCTWSRVGNRKDPPPSAMRWDQQRVVVI
jgi:hypothetical protein